MTLLLMILFTGLVSVVFHVPHGLHQWTDEWTRVVAICSIMHSFLPPYDWNPDFVNTGFAEFPSFQTVFHGIFNNRYYRLLIYVIGYLALNGRSTVWAKAISIKTQLAQAVNNQNKENVA